MNRSVLEDFRFFLYFRLWPLIGPYWPNLIFDLSPKIIDGNFIIELDNYTIRI